MSRDKILSDLKKNPELSVLIIGAGINGIGTFRDLALNGVDALIIDRADFCSGASAASSHMLHGGLRYLENAEFRLVKEALHERNLLLRNAPHYAKPLPTTIPVFKLLSGLLNAPLKFLNLLNKPAERGAVIIKLGLMMYDAYVRGESPMPGHYFHSREKSLGEYPPLNPEIICTANYYDGAMVAMERFCVELILDAEAEGGHARALNYTSVGKAEGGTVTLHDELSGKPIVVKPRIVVNAAGPWIDFANRSLGRETKFIGGTKGSHLVVDHPELRKTIGSHGFFFENYDGRIVEINPFHDRILVGTTDIRIDDPDTAICDPDEEKYILSLVDKVFPTIKIKPEQVVYRYSGVRPLPASSSGLTGQISRDHSIEVLEPDSSLEFPILNLIGGKWTTYRAFSEQTADAVMARLGKRRHQNTKHLPVGGGKEYPASEREIAAWVEQVAKQTRLDAKRVRSLFEKYGTRAEEMAVFIASAKDKPLKANADYSHREIEFLTDREHVRHLDDLILRRTMIGLMGLATRPLLQELAAVAGRSLKWSEKQVKAEIQRTADILYRQHGVMV
jgi:glycerol-3-phosphate dehydrogenase